MSALTKIEEEMRDAVPRILRREPAKVIAFRAGVTERTAENWASAKNLPNAPSLLALAREYPELRDLVLRWLDTHDADEVAPDLAALRRIKDCC